jgi:hypothetical protein
MDLGTLFFLPDNGLRYQRLGSKATERPSRRNGYDRNNTATNSSEHIFTNTIILCQQRPNAPTRRRAENQSSSLTKHQTSQPQYMRGSCAPFIYAYDRKRTWVLHFLARQQFTVSEIEEYAMERRNIRDGYGQKNNNNINSTEHIFKNTIILCQ